MRKQSHIVFSIALMIGDFLAIAAAFTIAYVLRVKFDPRPLLVQIPPSTYILIFLSLIPFWLIIFSSLGLYSKDVWSRWLREAWRLLVGSFAGLLFIIGYQYATNEILFPARLVAVYALLLGFILLLIERWIMRLARQVALSYGIGTTRVMIIGDSDITKELAEQLIGQRGAQYHVSAIVASKKYVPEDFKGKVYESFDQGLRALKRLHVESILLTELYKDDDQNQQLANIAAERHLEYRFVPQPGSVLTAHSELELFSGFPVLTLHQTSLIGWGRVIKKIFDFISSSIAIILVSPLLLIIGLLIKIGDGGPIFFRHKRLTRFGKEIAVWKFRTMHIKYSGRDPEEVFKELGRNDLIHEYRENRSKVSEDPRVTRFGRFLRRFSLDELPQLINVMKGEISLVGPRAIPKEELDYFKEKGPLVLNVKTGITGLAQVSGRSEISLDERLQLDLYYVQNWSIWLDLKILWRTLGVVLSRKGSV